MSCFPFSKFRDTSQSGIQRFVSISTGREAWNTGSAAGGISCDTSTAIVIRMEENDLYHATSHF